MPKQRPILDATHRGAADPSALIVEVRRYCLDAGPGVRTSVHLKGCPLRCVWCAQPEKQLLRPEPRLDPGRWADDEPIDCPRNDGRDSWGEDRWACQACRRCAAESAEPLIETIGRSWRLSQLLQALEPDGWLFGTSGGGLTVAGGEPLYQSHFTLPLLAEARRRGWHTALETSGQAATSVFEEALATVDLLVFDLKETNLELHRQWTGAPLEPIIGNLVRAAVSPAVLWVRLPVVPLANDRDDHWQQAASLLADLPGPPVIQLRPYRTRVDGVTRCPSPQRLRRIAALLGDQGLRVAD